jgi:SAM-dependent methyltransferase
MPAAEVVRHFERTAAGYGGFRSSGLLGALRREELQAVRELAPVQRGERVLDAGCGDGAVLEWLRAGGARAVGVDATPAMARECRRRRLPVSVQDLERLGVKRGFDWVLCIGALEFTTTPEVAVLNLAAALRPGGRLVLLFPRRGWLGRLYAGYHRAHGVAIRLFTAGEIETQCRAAGLDRPSAWRDCRLSSVGVFRRRPSRADVSVSAAPSQFSEEALIG